MGSTFDYTYAERQRDIVGGLYNFLYLPDVIDDLEVTIGDEATNVITVTCALVNPAGEKIARRMVIKMALFADDTYADIPAADADIAYAATTGTILSADLDLGTGTDLTNRVVTFVTDEEGDLVFTITNSSDAGETFALGFFLPNGQFVPGGEFVFDAA